MTSPAAASPTSADAETTWPELGDLTSEQVRAAGNDSALLIIEAAPGSGKTTVAAQRFGYQRYRTRLTPEGRRDTRAVVAVSFTKSATRELQVRTRAIWGPTVLQWPHRILTIDAFVHEVVNDLLHSGMIAWPGGHTALTIHESWHAILPHSRSNTTTTWIAAYYEGFIKVVPHSVRKQRVPDKAAVEAQIEGGHCTHDDLRSVLATALEEPAIHDRVRTRVGNTIRCLIVDEVYDANRLDLRLVEIAAELGCEVTLIGDHWQALYGFRGASPDQVPELAAKLGMRTVNLTKSFRFRSANQQEMAARLRSGRGTSLRLGDPSGDCDVVLAPQWVDLWNLDHVGVIPLAWSKGRSADDYAMMTILLDMAARQLTHLGAVFKTEALQILGLSERDIALASHDLASVLLGITTAETAPALVQLYYALAAALRDQGPQAKLPMVDGLTVRNLRALGARLRAGRACVPGLTVHQAKGREWDRVGVALTERARQTLDEGLRSNDAEDRVLYVACTRARWETVEIRNAAATSVLE
ncbi:UvrD-helicase domain-containing protein [Nocardia asteroides]|uniref:UvrD-helicase domain-containing protein n=1 Tax=Nocardia asteroides TaxID=1824 RepID=UPI003434AA84